MFNWLGSLDGVRLVDYNAKYRVWSVLLGIYTSTSSIREESNSKANKKGGITMLVRQSRKPVRTISLRLISVLLLAPLVLGGCGPAPSEGGEAGIEGEKPVVAEKADEPVLSNDLIRGCQPVGRPRGLPPPPGMKARPEGKVPPEGKKRPEGKIRPEGPPPGSEVATIGLEQGGKAVDFTLKDIHGNTFVLSQLLASKPVVMIFGSFT